MENMSNRLKQSYIKNIKDGATSKKYFIQTSLKPNINKYDHSIQELWDTNRDQYIGLWKCLSE